MFRTAGKRFLMPGNRGGVEGLMALIGSVNVGG